MNDELKIFELYLEGAIKQEQPQMHVDIYGNKRWHLPDKMHLKKGHIHNKWLHREDGPAIEWENGDKSWWWQGERHRDDGPAIEHANGDKVWWLHGKLHREDGPAVEYAYGDKEWWLHNIHYSTAEAWAKALLKQRNKPHDDAAVDAFLKQILSKEVDAAL